MSYNRQYYAKNQERIKAYDKKNSEKRHEYIKNWRYEHTNTRPMSENKECSQFLGIHVAERVLSHVFDNVEMMSNNNHGFDFVCNKGKKIDVKSSCIRNRKKAKPYWQFNIRKNKIADYFLCLAFDNRKDLNPMHIWLIPALDVNHQMGISVTIKTFTKMDKYALDIDKVSMYCDILKGNK